MGVLGAASASATDERSSVRGSLSGVRTPSLLSELAVEGEADRAIGRCDEAMLSGRPGRGTNEAMAEQSSKRAQTKI